MNDHLWVGPSAKIMIGLAELPLKVERNLDQDAETLLIEVLRLNLVEALHRITVLEDAVVELIRDSKDHD